MAERLTIAKGSVDPFYLTFDADDISSATKASFKIALPTPISLTTTGITREPTRLKVVLTQVQADALVAGLWVAEAAVEVGGVWRHTLPFYIEVVATQADHF